MLPFLLYAESKNVLCCLRTICRCEDDMPISMSNSALSEVSEVLNIFKEVDDIKSG